MKTLDELEEEYGELEELGHSLCFDEKLRWVAPKKERGVIYFTLDGEYYYNPFSDRTTMPDDVATKFHLSCPRFPSINWQ